MFSTTDLLKLGKDVISTSVTLMPVIQGGISKIKDWYSSYTESEKKQMQGLQILYVKHCYEQENKHPITTLNIEKGTGGGSDQEKNLPIYLQMDGNRPVLYQRKFTPKISMEDWLVHLEKGVLRPIIEEMIGYLCQYQVERDYILFQLKDRESAYNYDPTNLFLEEFKAWLVFLSHARIDSDSHVALCKVICGRRDYLNGIIIKRVFDPNKENPPTRLDILQKVHDQLSFHVMPIIETEVARQSAREHFGQLKLQIRDTLHSGLKFLFYILRDSKDTPQNFILSQIRSPTMPFYQGVIKSTSGELLRCLLNTPMFKFIFPIINDSDHFQELYEIDALFVNPFNDKAGKLVYPNELISKNINPHNWYKDGAGRISGILPYFYDKGEETIKYFLEFHSLLHTLGYFYLVCDLLYEIAGDGGNLLVYGKAMELVRGTINHLQILLEKISANSQFLYQASNVLKIGLDNKKVEEKNSASNWRKNFVFADSGYQYLHQRIKSSRESLSHISLQLQQVTQKSYLHAVYQKLALLERVVNIVNGIHLIGLGGHVNQEQVKEEHKKEPALLGTQTFEGKKLLAFKLYKDKQYKEACEQLVALKEELPEDDEINYTLAELLYRSGRPELITHLLDVCIKNDEKSPYGKAARLLKVKALHKLGRHNAAKNEVDTLLSVFTEFEISSNSEEYQVARRLKQEIVQAMDSTVTNEFRADIV